MGKYNVGDKVRIISERGELWNYEGKMDKYMGTVMTIRGKAYGHDGLYRMEEDMHENGGGWCWCDKDIVGLVKDEYKVGDRVIIEKSNVECIEKYAGVEGVITSISGNKEYPYFITSEKNEYGVYCKVKCLASENMPAEKVAEEKIVITHDGKVTTATLYGEFGNKETATARCAPEDTFDFTVGAALALERLNEKIEEAKNPLYNGKVVCIDTKFNGEFYTKGKIYQIKNGQITADDGRQFPKDNCDHIKNTARIHNFDEWEKWSTAKWIEVVE